MLLLAALLGYGSAVGFNPVIDPHTEVRSYLQQLPSKISATTNEVALYEGTPQYPDRLQYLEGLREQLGYFERFKSNQPNMWSTWSLQGDDSLTREGLQRDSVLFDEINRLRRINERLIRGLPTLRGTTVNGIDMDQRRSNTYTWDQLDNSVNHDYTFQVIGLLQGPPDSPLAKALQRYMTTHDRFSSRAYWRQSYEAQDLILRTLKLKYGSYANAGRMAKILEGWYPQALPIAQALRVDIADQAETLVHRMSDLEERFQEAEKLRDLLRNADAESYFQMIKRMTLLRDSVDYDVSKFWGGRAQKDKVLAFLNIQADELTQV